MGGGEGIDGHDDDHIYHSCKVFKKASERYGGATWRETEKVSSAVTAAMRARNRNSTITCKILHAHSQKQV